METKDKKAEQLSDLMLSGKYKLVGSPFKMKISNYANLYTNNNNFNHYSKLSKDI